MIHIYEETFPLVLRHLVNGKNGYVILPEGEDEDGIYFEDWPTLTAWVRGLVDQVGVTPGEAPDAGVIESYDDWMEAHSA